MTKAALPIPVPACAKWRRRSAVIPSRRSVCHNVPAHSSVALLMTPFFIWLEHTDFSVWVRESPSLLAFPFLLILHAIGMGFLAGMNIAIDLRILGVSPRIPLAAMRAFFPFLWFGLIINVISGVSLLIGYPTKALTNWVFYLKLGLIGMALMALRWTKNRVFDGPEITTGQLPGPARSVAALSISCWLIAIVAGRLLAYTYKTLMSGE
ncbi:MAG: hypothetical protein ABI811_20975 [Acidobacteriota bacterium]